MKLYPFFPSNFTVLLICRAYWSLNFLPILFLQKKKRKKKLKTPQNNKKKPTKKQTKKQLLLERGLPWQCLFFLKHLIWNEIWLYWLQWPINCNRNYTRRNRVFTNGPGARGSILGWVIPKTQKMVLDASWLASQISIKSKHN